MEDNKEDVKPLYMPAGLKMRKEYFQGFGKTELIPTIISALMLCAADAVIYILGVKNVSLLFFIPVLGVTAVAFMHIKGELNLSPVDIIKLELQYRKSQKEYPYVAKNEWENISGDDEG